MKIIKYIITFFLFFSTAIHAASAPDVFLKDSVREVSQFISENKDMLENDQSFLQSKVDGLIIPKLDILLMSKSWYLIKARSNVSDFAYTKNPKMGCTYMITPNEYIYVPPPITP